MSRLRATNVKFRTRDRLPQRLIMILADAGETAVSNIRKIVSLFPSISFTPLQVRPATSTWHSAVRKIDASFDTCTGRRVGSSLFRGSSIHLAEGQKIFAHARRGEAVLPRIVHAELLRADNDAFRLFCDRKRFYADSYKETLANF